MAERMKKTQPKTPTKTPTKPQPNTPESQIGKPVQRRGGNKSIRHQDRKNTMFVAGEQQSKIARKGAYAAAEAKRRKKSNKQLVLSLLQCRPDLPVATKESLKKLGITGQNAGNAPDDYTIQLIATAAVMQKAMKGDIKAYELMMQIIGEKPQQTIVVQKDLKTTREVEDMLFGSSSKGDAGGD